MFLLVGCTLFLSILHQVAPNDDAVQYDVTGATSSTPALYDGQLRLVNGPTPYSGRVEVYYKGQWGTICDDSFDINDAKVICTQLGMYISDDELVAHDASYFGAGVDPITIDNLACTGDESTVRECSSGLWLTHNCGHKEDAGVTCRTAVPTTTTTTTTRRMVTTSPKPVDGDVRLVNGPSQYSGRVEVYYNGEWGTICDDFFDHQDVIVICRQLGFYIGDEYGQAYRVAKYGSGTGPVIVDDLECSGRELNISTCPAARWTIHDCGHSEDAGLDCHELYTETTTPATSGTIITRRTSTPVPKDLSTTTQVPTRASTGLPLPVDGELRLVNGHSAQSGRVEVFYHGAWGTVCDDLFDHNDVIVICRQLGLYQGDEYGIAYHQAYFGPGTGATVVDELECQGNEANITSCRASPWLVENCNHNEDAGVDCRARAFADAVNGTTIAASTRLSSTTSTASMSTTAAPNVTATVHSSLNLTTRHPSMNGTTSHQFTTNSTTSRPSTRHVTSNVAINVTTMQSPTSASNTYSVINMTSTRPTFNTTSVQSPNGLNASDGDLRLVNGTSAYSGRVEVYYNGQWGTVCDDLLNHDTADVTVICRQLGMYFGPGYGVAYDQAHYGEGAGPIVIDNLECMGNESRITECASRPWLIHDCLHSEDAGVDCQAVAPTTTVTTSTTAANTSPFASNGQLRLVNGLDGYSGRVEVLYNGVWGSVCDDHFDQTDAIVVCKQLGMYFGDSSVTAYGNGYFGAANDSMPIVIDELACANSDTHITSCFSNPWGVSDCGHGEDAGVACDGPLTYVRLVNGSSRYSGRVEVFYKGQWGTVCGNGFTYNDTRVICRQLGLYYGDEFGVPYTSAIFGEGPGPVIIDLLRCNGSEANISQCYSVPWLQGNCGHEFDAGVDCQARVAQISTTSATPTNVTTNSTLYNGSLRLVDGYSQDSGRVEVYYQGQWGTICDDDFDIDDARVICRQLGYNVATGNVTAFSNAYFGYGSDPTTIDNLHCLGNETSITQCPSNDWLLNENCDHSEDAGVDCYGQPTTTPIYSDGQLRLVDGPDMYSGRVEVYYQGAWGTVCDDYFNRNDAIVVCKQLGFYISNASSIPYASAYFGSGSGLVVIDDLTCFGNETHISQCPSEPWLRENCGHGEDAGVDCHAQPATTTPMYSDGQLRLVDGPDMYSGRVEVYYQGAWGTVCDDDFDINDARVICKQLGFYISDVYTFAYSSAYFGSGYDPIVIDDVRCLGNETHISQCPSSPWLDNNCDHAEDAGVACRPLQTTTPLYSDGQLRLVDGPDMYSGRVEVYYQGAWGTVCDDFFDRNDAIVVCKQLGYYISNTSSVPYSSAYFGGGSGLIVIDDLNCYGNETDVTQCPSEPWLRENCGHGEDAGVDCNATVTVTSTTQMPSTTSSANGELRLVDGINQYSGRVEVFYQGQWGTICDDLFDYADAMVICRQLGLYINGTTVVAYLNAHYGSGTGSIVIDSLGCNGDEDAITHCTSRTWLTHDCTHSEDAGVDCRGPQTPIRLVDGPDQYSGRLEVYHDDQWGTVCDDSFRDTNVRVICQMLGYNYPDERWFTSAHFGDANSSAPIWMDELRCLGSETDISDCGQNGWGSHNCNHGEDVGISCRDVTASSTTPRTTTPTTTAATTSFTNNGLIRLADGTTPYNGRVEVSYNGIWGTICDDYFDVDDANVICRQLGLSGHGTVHAYTNANFGSGSGDIVLDDLQCTGTESNILSCSSRAWGSHNCGHSEDASVDCWYNWVPTTTPYNNRTTASPVLMYINGDCNEYDWVVTVDMARLKLMYPQAKATDIYLGENMCTGIENNGHLTFQYALTECLTSHIVHGDVNIYTNELIYAEHDPEYTFIIKHYNWTVTVECRVNLDGSTSSSQQLNNITAAAPDVYHSTVDLGFYTDANYLHNVSGAPLRVDVGEDVYVQVYTTSSDWNIKMRVHTCYAKPSKDSPDRLKYYLIKDGCEVDSNTHIISQSTHDTRFVFDNFEYEIGDEGIYVTCDVTFCNTSDYSRECMQTCNPI